MRALLRAHHAAKNAMSRTDAPVHFCMTGGRAIFLDLHRNRYFALPSAPNAHFAQIVGEGRMGTLSADVLRQIATGETIATDMIRLSNTASSTALADPTSDRLAEPDTPVPTKLVVLAWIAGLTAKLLVRLCPLRAVLAWLPSGTGHDVGAADDRNMDRIAAAFRKVGLLMPSDGNCLPLTLAFVWLCRRFGHNPALVIGVRVNPFAAHCWSQLGATVLDDSCERVRSFQPILIL